MKELSDFQIISKDELNEINNEKINLAFDVLYLRYEMAINELVRYKNLEAKNNMRGRDFTSWGDKNKITFYNILEATLEAHSTHRVKYSSKEE